MIDVQYASLFNFQMQKTKLCGIKPLGEHKGTVLSYLISVLPTSQGGLIRSIKEKYGF